ncbi:MAG TPA: hypothetical protein VFB62_16875 [Polyangiaceae bacterium]|nr:hypothetical protein [Polyangiaceae bacterium]
MLRHPADPYFPLLAGRLAWEERDQNPMPWLQRALERSLVNGKAHILVATVVHATGSKSQALLELRLAAENDPTIAAQAARLAVSWAKTLDELISAAPTGPARAASLDAMASMMKDRSMGAQCDRLALETDANRSGPHERLANDVLETAKAEKCSDREACEREFEQHVAAIERIDPQFSTGARLRAQWLVHSGHADDALTRLGETCESFRDFDRCLEARVQIAAGIDESQPLIKAAKAMLNSVCMDAERCAKTATWVGDLHMGRSEFGSAMTSFTRAVKEGETIERLVKLADAASRAGMHAQAIRALERALVKSGGKAPKIEQTLAQERAAIGASLAEH